MIYISFIGFFPIQFLCVEEKTRFQFGHLCFPLVRIREFTYDVNENFSLNVCSFLTALSLKMVTI